MDGFRVLCSNRLDRLIHSTEIKGYKHTYYADYVNASSLWWMGLVYVAGMELTVTGL